MIDTTTIRPTPACAPVSCRLRDAVVKKSVAAFSSGEGPRGRVDDALHADQGIRETVTGDHVDATRARYRDNLMSTRLEHVKYVAANPACRPDNGDPRWCLHDDSLRRCSNVVV